MKIKMRQILKKLGCIHICSYSSLLHAAHTGPSMPWDDGLTQIQNALTGNTAHALIVLAIAITGIAVAVGETDSVFRKAASIVFGGSIAVGAVSLYSTLSFSGAVI